MKTLLTDLDLSEVSLVDKGANPGALITLFKRHDERPVIDVTKVKLQNQIARARIALSKHEDHDQSSHGNRFSSSNEGRGFHGAALESALTELYGVNYNYENLSESEIRAVNVKASESFGRVANELHSMGLVSSIDRAKQFLDSRQGRHLGDQLGLNGSVQDASHKIVSGLLRQWKQGN